MAANVNPIYSKEGILGGSIWTSSLTGNTTSDGTGTIGTNMVLALTAGADGNFLDRIRFSPAASAAATVTTGTVVRVYVSTITSGATTRADTFLIGEIALSAQTADHSTSASTFFELPLGFVLPTGFTLLFSMHHAAAANTSWSAVVIGGKY